MSAENEPLKVNGRIIERGTEVSIRGERGRYRFLYLSPSDGSATVYGGPLGYGSFRSFTLDRIRTVHSKNKTRANEAA